MKKASVIILIAMLLSCTKERSISNKEIIALSKNTSIGTPLIGDNVESMVVNGLTATTTFKHSNITAKITLRNAESDIADIVLTAPGMVNINRVAIISELPNLTHQFKLSSSSLSNATVYTSFEYNEGSYLNNLFVGSQPPVPQIDGVYLSCMTNAVNLCKTRWLCKGLFGTSIFGIVSAGIGWSIGCLTGHLK